MTVRTGAWLAGLILVLGLAGRAEAQPRTVKVTVPAGVAFSVVDVSATTTGSPAPSQILWSAPTNFPAARRLRISVRADTVNFAGPGTTRIAANKVSWTAAASSGTPSNGTLSSAAYTVLYLSNNNLVPANSGTVSITWQLAPVLAVGLRSGAHTLTARWRFEAF